MLGIKSSIIYVKCYENNCIINIFCILYRFVKFDMACDKYTIKSVYHEYFNSKSFLLKIVTSQKTSTFVSPEGLG